MYVFMLAITAALNSADTKHIVPPPLHAQTQLVNGNVLRIGTVGALRPGLPQACGKFACRHLQAGCGAHVACATRLRLRQAISRTLWLPACA